MKNTTEENFLHEMLQKQRNTLDDLKKNIHKQDDLYYEEQIITQRAEKGATIRDFIDMVADLTNKVLKTYEATFDPDEGHMANDVNKNLGHPYINYKLISRIPKLERKERLLNTIKDKDGRSCEIWSQSFICTINFNIFAGTYTIADKLMTDFEDMLSEYAGYFKQNGVQEILFKNQMTDENYDIYRQSMSIRSLQYRIDIQRIKNVFDTTIEDVQPIQHKD